MLFQHFLLFYYFQKKTLYNLYNYVHVLKIGFQKAITILIRIVVSKTSENKLIQFFIQIDQSLYQPDTAKIYANTIFTLVYFIDRENS